MQKYRQILNYVNFRDTYPILNFRFAWIPLESTLKHWNNIEFEILRVGFSHILFIKRNI